MIDELTISDFDDVRRHFNLPSAALAEKDWYVVKALAAIAAADTAPFRLVFGGGTSLSRAHGLIQRMSEDIDLKITGDREPTRPELRHLRETITKALLDIGFSFDPGDRAYRDSRNESRYTIYRLPYDAQSRGEGALRPEIQIEVAVWPLRRPAVDLPVRSFVAEAFGRPAEVASIPCVSINQTAAEKFVGLTRRVAAELADTTSDRDPTLVRHIYDLHIIRPHYDPVEVAALAGLIMPHDAEVFGNQRPSYRTAPLAETRLALSAFPNHFGFFLPLAGITTVKQVRESSFDIRATSRLNRLYIELLKDNPDWGTAQRRHDMNHFMARLIFCFFAEDTDIFNGSGVFTSAIEKMSAKDSSNTHDVISALFRAMNTKSSERANAGVPRWADGFPYVNGGLFSGSTDVPRFSRIARSYLLHIGNLDWKKINPDIFGSMIQAVADDDERGALGMHYTSVPNILKVLNPLFLDDLRESLIEAGDNARMLLNLRKRMSKIRVFDPACGSGNFLVIAYKEMRAIEAEINRRRDEADQRSEIRSGR